MPVIDFSYRNSSDSLIADRHHLRGDCGFLHADAVPPITAFTQRSGKSGTAIGSDAPTVVRSRLVVLCADSLTQHLQGLRAHL